MRLGDGRTRCVECSAAAAVAPGARIAAAELVAVLRDEHLDVWFAQAAWTPPAERGARWRLAQGYNGCPHPGQRLHVTAFGLTERAAVLAWLAGRRYLAVAAPAVADFYRGADEPAGRELFWRAHRHADGDVDIPLGVGHPLLIRGRRAREREEWLRDVVPEARARGILRPGDAPERMLDAERREVANLLAQVRALAA